MTKMMQLRCSTKRTIHASTIRTSKASDRETWKKRASTTTRQMEMKARPEKKTSSTASAYASAQELASGSSLSSSLFSRF